MDNINFDLSLVKQEPVDESCVFSQCFTTNILRYPLTLKTEPDFLRDCTTIQDMFEYKQNYDFLNFKSTDIEPKLESKTDLNAKMTDVYSPMDNSSTIPQRRKRSIDRKKVGNGTPYTSVPLPPCKVCGGNATGYHFGVITCEACKVKIIFTII